MKQTYICFTSTYCTVCTNSENAAIKTDRLFRVVSEVCRNVKRRVWLRIAVIVFRRDFDTFAFANMAPIEILATPLFFSRVSTVRLRFSPGILYVTTLYVILPFILHILHYPVIKYISRYYTNHYINYYSVKNDNGIAMSNWCQFDDFDVESTLIWCRFYCYFSLDKLIY